MRVAIIGAGMAGASLGYFLARSAEVVLLEAEAQPGYHSTGRSAAMFIPTYGAPMARALTAAGRAFLERPPDGFADAPLLSPRGVLYAAGPGAESHLDELVEEAKREGVALERIGAAAARDRIPVLRTDWVTDALLEPDTFDMDVHAMHQGYLKGLRSSSGRVVASAAVVHLKKKNSGWEIETRAGKFEADIVVNAAGAWADHVGRLAGFAPVGLQPRRRSAMVFAPPAGADVRAWPAVASADESFYFKPDAGKLLGSPANEDDVDPQDVQPEELDIALAIDRIQTATTLEIRRPERTWAGLRSFVADRDLVAGFEPADPSFFWLCGHGGCGIQTSAGLGAAAAALVLGNDLPAEARSRGVTVERLSPTRLRPASR